MAGAPTTFGHEIREKDMQYRNPRSDRHQGHPLCTRRNDVRGHPATLTTTTRFA